jgi:4-hydroxybenzoate polyprenyltransferase
MDEWGPLAIALVAFLVFCLLSGAVYLVNDVVDVDADRRHPQKRHRPIASGQLPLDLAKKLAGGIGVVALGGAFAVDWRFGLAALGYLALNLAYSLWAKQVAYLDVVCVATGFLLRVVAGALAIQVPISGWLVTCAFLLALFLALGKRRQELRMSTAGDTRSVLLRYTPATLDMASYAVGFFTLVAYVTDLLPATTPFVAFALWRFLSVVDHARTESPTEAMLRDPPLVAAFVMWVGFILVAIYVSP